MVTSVRSIVKSAVLDRVPGVLRKGPLTSKRVALTFDDGPDDMTMRYLDKLDDLGVTGNTIVIYTTDNGNELLFWPDGGYAPFRGEKGTTWEGGVRVPCVIRWPGKIPAGRVSNEIQSHEDLYVTLAAAAGTQS